MQTKPPKEGDYVLATKFSDGDPADAWCVGYYMRATEYGRHLVGGSAPDPNYPNGYRYSGYSHVALIDEDLGNWLVKNAAELERSPAGSVNLWQIRTNRMTLLFRRDPEKWSALLSQEETLEFAEK